MHMNLPPICLARSVCCACAREERSAPEDAVSAITREKAATRRLVMPFPKRHGRRERLRLLRRGTFWRAGQDQDGSPVRQERNQRAQHHHQAAQPDPLYQRIQIRVNDHAQTSLGLTSDLLRPDPCAKGYHLYTSYNLSDPFFIINNG